VYNHLQVFNFYFMSTTALITGASSGIGKELATIHAAAGGDVVLVARSTQALEQLQQDLEATHSITATIITKDLAVAGAATALYAEIKERNLEIDYLINNAGFGGVGLFHEQDWKNNQAMIQLNVTTLAELTRVFLPDMIARGSGKILNVSSIASLMAGPLQAVYFATKAFVTSFSYGISEELAGTGVTVTALLPGATDTKFSSASGLDKTSLFANPHSAKDVAQVGYDAMLAGKLSVLAGASLGEKIFTKLIPFVPKKLLLKQVKKMQQTI
jgi:short-subunit dehydrogenase